MGYAVVPQNFEVRDRRAINLEVVLEPSAATSRGTLVIGAHYDTVVGTPGADDNTSAVAILLEIARHMADVKVRRCVRFVFFDCEEPPYFNFGEMGSQHHAAELRRAGEKLMGMICLESLGYYCPPMNIDGVPAFARWLLRIGGGRNVVIVSNVRSSFFGLRFCAAFLLRGLFPFLPAALPVKWVPDIALSDHRGYWSQGYPALMITDTAHLRNPNYHMPSDRLATLDFPRMTRLCRQLQRTIAAIVR